MFQSLRSAIRKFTDCRHIQACSVFFQTKMASRNKVDGGKGMIALCSCADTNTNASVSFQTNLSS